MDVVGWILLILVATFIVFKLGQAYEREKPEITFKFTCEQPHCRFNIESNSQKHIMELSNEHAKVHLAMEEDIARNSGTSDR